MTENEKAMETCQHVWVYDHREHETLFVKCPRCGLTRPTLPGEAAARVGRELRIRHDGKDGDV